MENNDVYIPDRLIKSFFDEGVVAFVGAGLSANEGLPTWQVLIENMFQELNNELSESEQRSIIEHIDAKNFLLVADYLKSRFNEPRFKEFIENTFSLRKESKIHSLLLSIPFKGIITTNYDNIFSYSDAERKFNLPFTYDDPDVFRKTKQRFLLHAHGMAATPKSTILSFTDYDNLNHAAKNIAFWETMLHIFQRYRVLFLGYSLNNPDINLFLTKLKFILPGNLNEHLALIYKPNSDLLDIYRITKLFGVEPVYLPSKAPIGESIYQWLEKLKSVLLSKTPNHVHHNNESNGYKDPRLANLMDYLFQFIKENYDLNKFVQKIDVNLANHDYILDFDNFKNLGSKFLLKLPSDDLKKLIADVILDFPNNANLKRLITYMP